MDAIEKFYYWKLSVSIWMRVLKLLILLAFALNFYLKSKQELYSSKELNTPIYIMLPDTIQFDRYENEYFIMDYHTVTREPLKPIMKYGSSYIDRVKAIKKWQKEHKAWRLNHFK